MAIRNRVLFPLVILSIAACGGGGDGGSSASAPAPTPNPPPRVTYPSLALSDTNAIDAAKSALGGSEAVVVAARGAATPMARSWVPGQRQLDTRCGLTSSGGKYGYVDNDGSGSLSAGDRIHYSLDCNGVALSLQGDISAFSAQGYSVRVSFEQVRTSPSTRAVGSFALVLDGQGFRIADASADFTIDGFVEALVLPQATFGNEAEKYVISLDGTVNSDRLDASFAFKTVMPLRGFGGSFPDSGALLLSAGSSSALFQAPTGAGIGYTGDYRVNLAGAGYGVPRASDWRSLLIGSMFFWIPESTPMITRLDLTPADPAAYDVITASYDIVDPNNDSLSFTFTWQINGVLQPVGSFTNRLLPTGSYRRGDVIEVWLHASDLNSAATATRSITVGNAEPGFAGEVTFSPTLPNRTQAISAHAVATDIDGDAVTYSYAWRRNGTLLPGEVAGALPAGSYTRGDVISVVVTASDGQRSATREASVTIVDAAPIVSAVSAPTNAAYGVPLTFDTNVADPDGDSVTGFRFRLEYGPAGMAVDAVTGLVSWQPNGVMFDKSQDFAWRVTVDSPVAIPAAGVIGVTDPSRRYPLMRSAFGYVMHSAGLKVGDFDGDGDEEALLLTSTGFYELESDGAQGYRQAWMYPFAFNDRENPYLQPDITAFATADLDGDDRQEIFVASRGVVARLDGVERRVDATASLGEEVSCAELEYGDLDRDGAAEIVCLTQPALVSQTNSLLVLDASAMSVLRAVPASTYGKNIALGNVDSDNALEIVTAGGHVIDGRSLATEWQYTSPASLVFDVQTADLDRDGIDEIVAAEYPATPIRVYDAVTRSLRWQVTAGGESVGGLAIRDLDGDGGPEIVVGHDQTGPVTAYRVVGNSAEVMFMVNYQRVQGIGLGDLDGDGATEILWSNHGAGLIAAASGSIEWESGVELEGPFSGGELAGSTLEPRAPLFMSKWTSAGSGGSRLLSMSPATGNISLSPDLTDHVGASALLVTDYDLDGTDEAIVAHANQPSRLFAYDPFEELEEWESPGDFLSDTHAVALAKGDLTGDGRDDVVSISVSGRIEVYDVFMRTLVWRSAALIDGRDVAVGDLNGDGTLEIVALTYDKVRIFSRTSPTSYLTAAIADYSSLWVPLLVEIADTDGDGEFEIIVLADGSYSALGSQLRRFDDNLSELGSFTVPWHGHTLAIEPSSTPRKNLLVAAGYALYGGSARIVAIDSANGHIVWRSPILHAQPWADSLNIVTLPGTAQQQLTIATTFGVYLTR